MCPPDVTSVRTARCTVVVSTHYSLWPGTGTNTQEVQRSGGHSSTSCYTVSLLHVWTHVNVGFFFFQTKSEEYLHFNVSYLRFFFWSDMQRAHCTSNMCVLAAKACVALVTLKRRQSTCTLSCSFLLKRSPSKNRSLDFVFFLEINILTILLNDSKSHVWCFWGLVITCTRRTVRKKWYTSSICKINSHLLVIIQLNLCYQAKEKKGTRFCKQEPIEAVVQHGACNSFTAYRGTAEVKYIKKLCF